MASPFELFRRNPIWVVILIALSMLAFVILGAIQDPTNVPAPLWILAGGLIFGAVGWVLGLGDHKEKWYAAMFAVLGLAGGTLVARLAAPSPSLSVAGNEMSEIDVRNELDDTQRANTFLVQSWRDAGGQRGGEFALQSYFFDLEGDRGTVEDVAVRKALDAKADELGIVVTDEQVNSYLQAATGNNITSRIITDVRKRLGLSEAALYDVLRNAIRRKEVFALLNSDSRTELPPAAYFDLYRRLNDTRNIQAVEIPVAAFLDEDAEPTDEELQSLFEQYRRNMPNRGPDGRPVPGQPGFVQPTRMKVASLEISLEDAKTMVEEPTEEELRALYAARYQQTVEPPAVGAAAGESPAMPEIDDVDVDALADELEADLKATDEQPATNGAADEKPAESGPGEAASDEAVVEEPSDETSWTPAGADRQAIYPVAFWQDAPADEAMENAIQTLQENVGLLTGETAAGDTPKQDKPTRETPKGDEAKKTDKAEKPAMTETAEKADAEAADKPAAAMPDESAKPDGGEKAMDGKPSADAEPIVPPAPGEMDTKDAPEPATPSFEEAREELREELILQKARAKMRELNDEALNYVVDKIQLSATLPPEDEDYITAEQASEIAQAYAEEQGLVYTETPLLSVSEMFADEEYAITAAFDIRARTSVPQAVAQAGDDFSPSTAFSPTGSQFVYWRTAVEPSHEPIDLNEEGVREQVVEAWRLTQARPLAEARAKELAEQVAAAEGEQPLAEVASDATVTGEEDAAKLSVREADAITYLTQSSAVAPNPLAGTPPPRFTDVGSRLGASVPLAQDFLATVFEKLEPGEAGVSFDEDQSSYWVVYVEPGDVVQPGDEFKSAPVFGSPFSSPYPQMAAQFKGQYGRNWRQALLDEYGVELDPEALSDRR